MFRVKLAKSIFLNADSGLGLLVLVLELYGHN